MPPAPDYQEALTRIAAMEECMNAVEAALRHSQSLADPAMQEKIRRLTAYMESGLWLADYERDARGELPPGLKRGVLSQDGLYGLLEEIRQARS